MAKTKGRAGKRASASGRNQPQARKSGAPKDPKFGSRKPKPAKSAVHEQKASLASETVRLKLRLKTARLQQQASAEILSAVANAAGDAAQPLQLIAKTTARLFGAASVAIRIAENGRWARSINIGEGSHRITAAVPPALLSIDGHNLPGMVFRENRQIHLPDLDNPASAYADWPGIKPAREAGTRVISLTPLRRGSEAFGVLVVHRDRLVPFTPEELALQQSFADQAAIAIENARLFNELRTKSRELGEALQQQTATAEVLQVTSNSPGELQPVFRTVLENATRICDARFGTLLRFDGNAFYFAADVGTPTALAEYMRRPGAFQGLAGGMIDRIQRTRQVQHSADYAADAAPGLAAKLGGARSTLGVPILRDDVLVGAIVIYRHEVRPFSDREIDLVRNFAAQAAIAIENARLFNETKEALERQTATAGILQVIAGSPSQVQPVFDAVAERAMSLLDCWSAIVVRFDGELVYFGAARGALPDTEQIVRERYKSMRPDRASLLGRSLLQRAVVNCADAQAEPDGELREYARKRGLRAVLIVPLLRKDSVEGALVLTRAESGLFAPREIELVQTFADQAVIAIENTRLFNETQEALERQTATAEVLQVINSSPGNLAPVFDAILEKAHNLCGAAQGSLQLYDGSKFRAVAVRGLSEAFANRLRQGVSLNPNTPGPHLLKGARFVQIPDLSEIDDPLSRAGFELAGIRTVLFIPLRKDGRLLGRISASRPEVKLFSEKEIGLLESFAAQAVIAIENARLFNEVQAKSRDLEESLQQQTATSEVLQVISASPGELGPVFDKMLENATRVCGAGFGSMVLVEGDMLRQAAFYNAPVELAAVRTNEVRPIHPLSGIAAAVRSKHVVQVEDIRSSPSYLARAQHAVELAELGGARTLAVVPMVRDDEAIGVITVYRQEVRLFGEKQIDLLTNFARQAVIAIENARLLGELRQRTADLSKSLDDLRTAQDRLVQTEKLASLGQLTAGIAHEIKNPLNFVNNFSALSIELTDDLNDLLKQATLAEKLRGEVDELTILLKHNLGKVVQHGKRADSIVKNMLLHSREGSGERRSADINALVGESLNLAYHGARAEKADFSITLKHDFDPNAGSINLYPQEITRALLNLISNGFYAASRRKVESGDESFEPFLSTATRNLGKAVEIRIRDNGNGIPPEVREKMFNPFFTTKPTGEGTGLGLSMTHDIVVKQHGGRIDVETEPGSFTEFIITLPRDNGTAAG